MPNHFHLIATAPGANISEAMHLLMRGTSIDIAQRGQFINQLYGNRHFKSAINKDHYFQCVYKYVYRNPVEAKLSSKVEDYPFSSLSLKLKSSHLLKLEEDLLLTDNAQKNLAWLNQAPKDENKEAVRRALSKGVFKFSNKKGRNHFHPLENSNY